MNNDKKSILEMIESNQERIKKQEEMINAEITRINGDLDDSPLEVQIELYKKGPSMLRWASEKTKDNRPLILELVKSLPLLQNASERLRDDEEVVLEAVKSWNKSLEYASERLKKIISINNEGEVLIKRNGNLECVGKTNIYSAKDKYLILEALKNGGNLQYVDNSSTDKDFVSEAAKRGDLQLQYVENGSNDKDFVSEIAKKDKLLKNTDNEITNPVKKIFNWTKDKLNIVDKINEDGSKSNNQDNKKNRM